MVSIPQFSDSLERTIWVQGQLRLIGSSFSAIAEAHKWSRSAVSNAMHMPNNAQERAIAAALGIQQEALFPERFDSEGRRLHPVKNKRVKTARNVKHSRAA